jgi:protein SCO1
MLRPLDTQGTMGLVKEAIACALAAALWASNGTWAAEGSGQPSDPQDPHAHHRAMMAQPPQTEPAPSGRVQLEDRQLKDQEGETVRFKSDVVGDHIIVADFIYTTCTTVCPVISQIFSNLQAKLGEHLGKEVRLVSISIDPARDTPPRLKQYSGRYHAKTGWIWLTGAQADVDEVLKDLDAYSADYTQHPSTVLVGDAHTGTWTRFYGFPNPEKIKAKVDELLAARSMAELKAKE